MTLDKLIDKLIEAKNHCVPGNSQVHIWSSIPFNVTKSDKLEGDVSYVNYDNLGVNLYFDKDE